jgi:hypothetical protein
MAFTYESIGSHRVTDIFKVDDWFGGCCDRSHEIEEGEETPRNDGSSWDRSSSVVAPLFWEGMCFVCSSRFRMGVGES